MILSGKVLFMKKPKKRRRPSGERLLYTVLLLMMIAVLAGGIRLVDKRSREDKTLPAPVQTAAPVQTTTTAAAATTATTAVTTTTETTTTTVLPGSVTGISLSFYHALLYCGDPAILPVVRMEPADALDPSELWESSDPDVAAVDESGYITPVGTGSCTVSVRSVSNPSVTAQIRITVEEAPAQRTTPPMSVPSETTYTATVDPTREDIQVIGGITYVQGVMIVNKTYPLPDSYNPGGLIPEAAEAFSEMRQAASADGISLFSHSDFRSRWSQAAIYQNYCNRDGKDAADRFSARPGYSEHQTGMVIDVNWPGPAFDDTPAAVWLEENCWKYGYIIRYPRDKEEYTGYKYESWHIRYVGREWAEVITESGLSMEEFFQVTSAYPS